MRFTARLDAQHLGFMFKKLWHQQGKRIPRDLGSNAVLAKFNIQVLDPKEVVTEKPNFERVEIDSWRPKPVAFDETHPNWNSEKCYILRDKHVVLEGLRQAQVLTKTIEINGLPRNLEESYEKIKLPSISDTNMQNAILASHVFDTEQTKTAIIKVPDRPAFVLPRNWSISDSRKNRLIVSKLLFECEKLSGQSLNAQRKVLNDAIFVAPFEKDGEKMMLDITAETFVTSKRPIEPVKGTYDAELPDLYPVKHTITIPQENIYKYRDFYPVPKALEFSHPHTIFLHYSPLDIKNLHETPVTETQFEARTLLKAFAVAASRAKQLYGETSDALPKPIVVQSVQTDGRRFHIGVFQLNTLDLNTGSGQKNYWFHLPRLELFAECTYKSARPILTGFNPEVLKYLTVLYKH